MRLCATSRGSLTATPDERCHPQPACPVAARSRARQRQRSEEVPSRALLAGGIAIHDECVAHGDCVEEVFKAAVSNARLPDLVFRTLLGDFAATGCVLRSDLAPEALVRHERRPERSRAAFRDVDRNGTGSAAQVLVEPGEPLGPDVLDLAQPPRQCNEERPCDRGVLLDERPEFPR